MTQEIFTRELERRADQLHDVPLTFEDVRGRAHQIRRRRRVAVGAAAVAAVLAIALPSALLSGGSDRSAPDPAPSPEAPQGSAAAILHDGAITTPDGAKLPIDVSNRDVGTFGVLSDGRVVLARTDRAGIQVYGADGQLDSEIAVETTALAISPTDRAAAWIDENGMVQVLESGVAEPVSLARSPSTRLSTYSVEAVIGDDCGSGGCEVLLGDGNTTSKVVTTDGVEDLSPTEPLRVWDVSPDEVLWSVAFPSDEGEQFGCVGLYDPEADEVVARNCATSNLTFSPDGKHLLGSRLENNMAGEVTMLDLGLVEVGRYAPTPRVISRAAWADDTHVVNVVATLGNNQWSLVHTSLDGTEPEVVDGPYAGGNPELYTEYLPSL